MPDKNALAELASGLSLVAANETTARCRSEVRKAQRIVAELAKVGFWQSTGRSYADESSIAVSKCREIAEEGSDDGE